MRQLVIGILGSLLFWFHADATEQPQSSAYHQGLKASAARARSGVLKVECLGQAGANSSAILSAVAIDDDGDLLTVGLRAPGDRKLCVWDCDGKRHEAQWVGADEESGLTLLKVKPGTVTAMPLADSEPEVGSMVIVVGNPFGLSHSVSFGNISGLDRTVNFSGSTGRRLIQFTAPIHPGDSGGLLADSQGRMVGIIRTALVEPEATGERRVPGIGFAIPASQVRQVVQRLREGTKFERGYLGVKGEEADPEGVRITAVVQGSPAESAGLRVGDVIVALDDTPVKGFDDLAGKLDRMRPGTELKLKVRRDGEELSVPATLGERKPTVEEMWRTLRRPRVDIREMLEPDALRLPGRNLFAPDGILLGVKTQPVSQTLAKSQGLPSTDGALVNDVIPNSPADRAGVRASDLIVSLGDEPVKSPQQLHELIQKAGPGAKITLAILRDGQRRTLDATLAQPGVSSQDWVVDGPVGPWRGPGTVPLFDFSQPRMEALERRVKELERKVEELEKRLQSQAPGAK